ncbi:MAG: N-formylglutamate amidohydrolase, partial [bacterium]|nr:N-formylglutamate amidohydrolase [bacterium]
GNLGDADGRPTEPFNRVTCPPEMIRFAVEEFARVFAHEDVELEVPATATANVPFEGGYVTRTVDAAVTPFFQIEMSRELYLAKPYFDDETLEVDERRLKDLNAKVWRALENIVRNL